MKTRRSIALLAAASLLAASAVLITGCGKKSNPMSPVSGADVTITIVANNLDMSYSPNPATAKVGQTVAWHNTAGTTHTATANGGGFDTGNIANGATSAPITMTTAGTFGYKCSLHPSMVGTLTVNP